MDLKEIADFLPLVLTMATFGVTWAVHSWTTHQGKIDAPDWLIFVPLGLGFGLGIPHYLYVRFEELSTQPKWVTVVGCIIWGFGYAGAAVISWELRKRLPTFLGKLIAREGVQNVLAKIPFKKKANGSSPEEPPTQSKGDTP